MAITNSERNRECIGFNMTLYFVCKQLFTRNILIQSFTTRVVYNSNTFCLIGTLVRSYFKFV